MPNAKPRLLFVDDEENIRLTLGMFLEDQGFSVTSVGTVPEALKLITQREFDILIADLNVGSPGDGFTVVSAMRRIRPNVVTFILTGYPAFDTALEAIRLQVDDYITKPTDIEALVQKIRGKLSGTTTQHQLKPRRLAAIISENRDSIVRDWLAACRSDSELSVIKISDADRSDHIPRVLEASLKIVQGEKLTPDAMRAARDHGISRRKQGFTVPLLLRETRLLHDTISQCVQANLLAIEISYLISDMVAVHQTIQILLEQSASAFLEGGRKS